MTGWRKTVLWHTLWIASIFILLVLVFFKGISMQKNKTELYQRVKAIEIILKKGGICE